MAEHLTLVTLRRAISTKSGVSEKVADDFLSALFSTIQDGLVRDGQVTVNGLGTFRLQDVPARESVNVVTGERITIDGYKKVIFVEGTKAGDGDTQRTPRGSKKKAEEPLDPIQKLGEQAEEIKDILSELSAMAPAAPAAEVQEIPESQESPEIPETPENLESPDILEIPETPETPPTPEQPQPGQPEKPSKPFNPWLAGLITVVVFAMLLIVAYFILRHQIIRWADNMRATIEQRIATPADEQQPQLILDVPATTDTTETTEATDTTEVTQTTETTEAPANPLYDDSQRTFTSFLPDETVGKDSRLAWIAKKRYGEKALWVFIYEANRDQLRSPDHVLPGMTLRIPKLPKELRDVNNPETKALLDRLSDKYLN